MHLRAIISGIACITALQGCDAVTTVVDAARDTTVAEVIGLGPDLPCDVDRFEARRMAGSYLRTANGTAGGTILAVSGRVRGGDAPLPRNLAVDDRKIRGLSADEQGDLSGRKQSHATPIAALNSRDSLPLAYQLGYRADGVDYGGPLVVGIPPLQDNIPASGQALHAGAVALTYTFVDDDGSAQTTQAIGDFAMRLGFGSGRAIFSIDNLQIESGPTLPFARLRWTRLGLCGARVVSSGQGVVSMYDHAGGRIPTFGPNADPSAGVLVFQATQFAASETTLGPTELGGVFAIQGDASSLTAVFLSRGGGSAPIP
ncbi:hypothetical protein SAMN04488005_1396 [Yoonia tamlensis]|uniref:Uncharacterized protein n=1 Tax=Yoonia tamlensis TaxID=390270 RepID=A0A1I6GBV3_9RHOB|nr:hypothetical protein [Yoonia tamlensis]SFR39669.1 hypothetical protein SAMN04488005_1396 [Yoonia tamlensis]